MEGTSAAGFARAVRRSKFRFSWAVCAALIGVLYSGCKSNPTSPANDSEPASAVEEIKNEEAPLPDEPLTAGQQVFDFQALAHTGQRISLSEFLVKPSLFYFCPDDAAPQCTQLALTIRDEWLRLNAHLDMVFAVTPAPTVIHREFASEHQLPHLLLADTDAGVHHIFGLKPGMLTAYLVGSERKILRVFPISDGATLVTQVEAALTELELLQPAYPL